MVTGTGAGMRQAKRLRLTAAQRKLAAANERLAWSAAYFYAGRHGLEVEEVYADVAAPALCRCVISFDPARGRLSSMLYSATRRGLRDHQRRARRLPADGDDIEDCNRGDETAAGVERAELIEQVRLASRTLPAEAREIVHLRFVHGLTFCEIGKALGVCGQSVRTRYYRILALLRGRLAAIDPARNYGAESEPAGGAVKTTPSDAAYPPVSAAGRSGYATGRVSP